MAAVEALEVGSCYPSADPDAAQRERQMLACPNSRGGGFAITVGARRA